MTTSKHRSRWLRGGIWLMLVLVSVVAALLMSIWLSRPALDGSLDLRGLRQNVDVTRDALGVVAIHAGDRLDAMQALGFVHAQERYFEMDLARRKAAGELAALFGSAALGMDRSIRPHGFRKTASRVFEQESQARRALLEAYTRGVNQGLDALAVKPWQYLLLRQTPEPWVASDSVLVLIAMFLNLNDGEGKRELALAQMANALPPEVYRFLVRTGTEWDAPLFGGVWPEPSIPGPESLDLRRFDREHFEHAPTLVPGIVMGSNQFAVSGRLTRSGGALLANDMHLGLPVPSTWFRAQWQYPDPAAPKGLRLLAGATLPGVPGLIVGSNQRNAWGLTNSYVDPGDWLILSPGRDPDHFVSKRGEERITSHTETLVVSGQKSEPLMVRATRFGPVLYKDAQGREWVYRFVAQRSDLINLAMLDLEHADSLDDALAVARRSGVPPLNFMLASHDGRIAWSLTGRFPERSCQREGACPGISAQYDPALPIPSDGIDRLWLGPLAAERLPQRVEPESGRLFTANQRVLDAEALRWFGDGGYALGARAAAIREGLARHDTFDEATLLALQLDARSYLLDRWGQLMARVLASSQDPDRAWLSAELNDWQARADVDSVSYRLVREFRFAVHEQITRSLAVPIRAQYPDFQWPSLGQMEGVVWQLLQEQPQHWLNPAFDSYDAMLAEAAASVLAKARVKSGSLSAHTWGKANRSQIQHPLARALPLLGPWLNMPALELPGDQNMARVQAPSFGASQRMVVSPGRETEAIFHMPGGQSGHPMSPFYGVGHQDWAAGVASPLLAGVTEHRLRLLAAAAD